MSNRKRPSRNRQGKPSAPRPTDEAIDFDALRAKRQRVVRQMPPVKIGGRNYTLAPTIPLAVTEFFAANAKRDAKGNVTAMLADMQHLLKVLFGEEQWAEISKAIDLPDVPVLFNTVFDAYREAVGESSNSGQS